MAGQKVNIQFVRQILTKSQFSILWC